MAGARMNWNPPAEVAQILDRALKGPLLPRQERERPPLLDRAAVEALLPYRDPFLLVDRVILLDIEQSFIVARYDIARAASVLAGHFPTYPVWPGVLQVEAIGQTGGILYLKQNNSSGIESVALTRILAARFLRPVVPGADVEFISQVFEEGLLVTVVGQCLQDDHVCSVAAVTAL
jgi:3-hydroxyacyl-[acyl-carrier-protein] dehydratase